MFKIWKCTYTSRNILFMFFAGDNLHCFRLNRRYQCRQQGERVIHMEYCSKQNQGNGVLWETRYTVGMQQEVMSLVSGGSLAEPQLIGLHSASNPTPRTTGWIAQGEKNLLHNPQCCNGLSAFCASKK